ncbi:preprotein translocase subunit SecE [Clostridium rectalis]|uniref:preprotein translocase subunit SecE n=1 Tax=Clostridium rectalis TaxID=2040295 RepID=UPI0013DE257B|nr:preprotein translocase subunit SecE [Clostridium rectalis]
MSAEPKMKKNNKVAPEKRGVIQFFKGIKSEIKRITWASKTDVKKAIATVFTFCLVYMVAIGIIDFGFNKISTMLLK